MRARHLPPPLTHVPRKSPSQTSAHCTYPNTEEGVVSMITVYRERGQVSGGQMSDHTWCLGICMCGDKISCSSRQLNGECLEGYCPGQFADRPTLTTPSHLPAEG